jgi:hypothetical protein
MTVTLVSEDFFNPLNLEWETRVNHPYTQDDVVKIDGVVYAAQRANWLEPPDGCATSIMWVLTPVRLMEPKDFAELCRKLAQRTEYQQLPLPY